MTTHFNTKALLAMVAAAGLGACTTYVQAEPGEQQGNVGNAAGDLGTVGTGDDVALFEANVQPLLEAKCATCHQGPPSVGPSFLGAESSQFYSRLVASGYVSDTPQESEIITKGPHDNNSASTFFTEAESAAVSAWIEALNAGVDEVNDADIVATGGQASLDAALDKMIECATLASFEATQAYAVCSDDSQAGRCLGCHQDGGLGFFCSASAERTHGATFTTLAKQVAESSGTQFGMNDWFRFSEQNGSWVAEPNDLILTIYDQRVDGDGNRKHPGYLAPDTTINNINTFQNQAIDCYNQ